MGSCTSGERVIEVIRFSNKPSQSTYRRLEQPLVLTYLPHFFLVLISQNILFQKLDKLKTLLTKALVKPNEQGISLKRYVISKSHLREAISQPGPRDTVVCKPPPKTGTFHESTTKFFWVLNSFVLIITKRQHVWSHFPKTSAYGIKRELQGIIKTVYEKYDRKHR